jgi:DNA-directed RNA polymerase subunit beta
VIEGDRRYQDREEKTLGSYGFSQQEFEGEDLVDISENSNDEDMEPEETFDEE